MSTLRKMSSLQLRSAKNPLASTPFILIHVKPSHLPRWLKFRFPSKVKEQTVLETEEWHFPGYGLMPTVTDEAEDWYQKFRKIIEEFNFADGKHNDKLNKPSPLLEALNTLVSASETTTGERLMLLEIANRYSRAIGVAGFCPPYIQTLGSTTLRDGNKRKINGEYLKHAGLLDDLKYLQSFFLREANFRIKRNAEAVGYRARLADGGIDLAKIAEMKKIVKDVKDGLDAGVLNPQRGAEERNEARQRQRFRETLEDFYDV